MNTLSSLPVALQGLTSLRQWVLYRDKDDKRPLRASDGLGASTTTPSDWCSYAEAVASAQQKGWGIGFVVTSNDPFTGIDLDSYKTDDPQILASHAKIIQDFASYTETTPNGGKRVLVKGNAPSRKADQIFVEVYSTGRYFTITGNVVHDVPIEPRQELLTVLIEEIDAKTGRAAYNDSFADDPWLKALGPSNLSNEEIVENVAAAWPKLWNAPPVKGRSKDDLALAKEIALFSRDPQQTAEVLKMAPSTQRDKVQKRPDYVQRTVTRAFNEIAFHKAADLENDHGSWRWLHMMRTPTIYGKPLPFTIREKAEFKGAFEEEFANRRARQKQGEQQSQQAGAESSVWSIDDIKDPRSYDFPPQEWIIPGWVCEGMYTVIVAGFGQGKSTLALALARAISEGRPFLGHDVTPRPVLYLDKENPWSGIKDRFDWLGMKMNNPLLKYFGLHEPGHDVPMPNDVSLFEWIERQTIKPVVVFDSLVRYLPSGNDASIQETTEFAARILRLRSMGAAPIVLHHTGKGETTQEGRGTTDITAACDFKLIMKATKLDGLKLRQIGVVQRRSRHHAEKGIPEDALIDISSSGAFTLATSAPAPEPETERRRPTQAENGTKVEGVLAGILQANPRTNTVNFEQLAMNHRVAQNVARRFLNNGVKRGSIQMETSSRNAKLYTWVGPTRATPWNEDDDDIVE